MKRLCYAMCFLTTLNGVVTASSSTGASVISILDVPGPQYKQQIAKSAMYPGFETAFYTAISVSTNLEDVIIGGEIGLLERRYQLGVNLGITTRAGPKKVLIEKSSSVYYQFREKRSLIHLGIERRFNIGDPEHSQKGLLVGFKGVYTYGKYRGSDAKLNGQFKAVPQAGVFFMRKQLVLKVMYEYLDFGYLDFGSLGNEVHRVNIIIGMNWKNFSEYQEEGKEYEEYEEYEDETSDD